MKGALAEPLCVPKEDRYGVRKARIPKSNEGLSVGGCLLSLSKYKLDTMLDNTTHPDNSLGKSSAYFTSE